MKNNQWFENADINYYDLIEIYREAVKNDFPLEKLDERIDFFMNRMEVSKVKSLEATQQKKSNIQKQVSWPIRIGSLIMPPLFMLAGCFLIFNALWPILDYYFFTKNTFQADQLLAPVPNKDLIAVSSWNLAHAQSNQASESSQETLAYQEPVILKQNLDYTNLSNWFDDDFYKLNAAYNQQELQEYVLEIPKLEITNAKVIVGGTDLNKGLIHYPGTAMPGEDGIPVIFGHSTLRSFYHPDESNPRRYKSIFSYLMTLELGDEIYLKVNNITYIYVVTDKMEVRPSDTYILAQEYDKTQLKLVTCVPEGTYLRRGIVVAELVKN